jgi:HEAT repeat protein
MRTLLGLRIVLLALAPGLFLTGDELPPLPSTEVNRSTAGDEKLLADNGVGRDGPALLKFLRLRSPTEEDRRTVSRLLADLASDSYDVREAATVDLVTRGPSVLADLKKLATHPDPEVRRRGDQATQEIESVPGALLSSAAIRLLVSRAPEGAVGALVRYLPFAEDELVEEEIVAALDRLTRDRQPESVLLDTLRDPAATVRGVGGQVLARTGHVDAVKLLEDADPGVRFRVALGCIAARKREAVPVLIALLDQDRQSICWQAEEVLYRLAGEKGPNTAVSLVTSEERQKARSAWDTWWRENGKTVDLGTLGDGRQIGLTLAIEYNTGRVWEAAPDRSLRFELKGLEGPMEAQVLPGGRVLVAESNAHKVTERDLKGNVLWTLSTKGHEPTGCQRLPNGNTFVSTFGKAMEFARDGTSVFAFDLPHGSNAIRKHRNGHVIFTTDDWILELDTTGKEVRRIPLPKESMWVGLRDLPGDRFLVANSSSGRVLEIDRTGQILWETRVAGACGVERSAAGHTLVGTANRVVEVDRAGNTVWQLNSPGYVRRVHRR